MSVSLGEMLLRVGLDLGLMAEDETKATAAIDSLGKSMLATGGTLTAALTAPLVGLFTASTASFASFESTMNKVSALGEITGADLKRLSDQAIDLGASTSFSAKEAAEGQAGLAAAGFNAQKIFEAMPGTLALAATEAMAVGTAARIAGDALNMFKLEASSSGHVADVLAAAAAGSNASVVDLGETLSYVGPTAHQAGMSIEETSAAAMLLSNAGITASRAGTSLSGILDNLVNPTKAQATVLEDLKVKVLDASGQMRPFNDIMLALQKSGISLTQTMRLFGAQSSAASVLISEAGDPLRDLETMLVNSDGAAKRMADTMLHGVGGAAEEFSGAMDTTGIKIGQILAPALTIAYNVGQSLLSDVVLPAIQWFSELPDPIKNGAIALAAIAAAAGPVLVGIGGMLLLPISTTMLAWVAGIAAAGAALAAIGTWVYDNWGSITAVVAQAWDGITDIWQAIWGPVISGLQTAWSGIKAVWETAWGPVQLAIDTAWSAVQTAFATGKQFVLDNLGTFALALAPVLVPIAAVVAAIGGIGWALYELGVAIVDAIPGVVSKLTAMWDGVTEAWTSTWAGISLWVTDTVTSVGYAIEFAWEYGKSYVVGLWDSVTEAWSTAWVMIQAGMDIAWSYAGTQLQAIFGPTIAWIVAAWDAVSDYWNSVWSTITTTVSTALGGMSTVISDIWNGIVGAAQAAWKSVTDAIGGTLQWVKDNVPGMDKLLTLDQAWSGAKNVAAEHKDNLQPELKNSQTQAEKLAGAIGPNAATGLTGALAKNETQSKKTTKETEKHRKEQEKLKDIADKNANLLIDLELRLKNVAVASERDAKAAFEKTATEAEKLNDKLDGMSKKVRKLNDIDVPDFISAMMKVETPINDAYDAMEKFGLKSAAELDAVVADLQGAYDKLVSSGSATQWQQDSAYLKVLEAMADKSLALSGQIPDDLQNAIKSMKDKADDQTTGLPSIMSSFDTMVTGISTGLGNIATDALNSLMHGETLSFDQLGSSMKSLGSSVLTNFTAPITDAIMGPHGVINAALKPLQDQITNVAGKFTEMATSALGLSGGTIPGLGGGSNPSAPGAGGAGAAAGGALGWVSAIGSVATAVSSVISNFQLARQEDTLNAIEESTRYLKVDFYDNKPTLKELVWESQNWLNYISDDLRSGPDAIRPLTSNIAGSLYWILDKIEGPGMTVHTLWDIRDKLGAAVPDVANIKTTLVNWDAWLKASLTTSEQHLRDMAQRREIRIPVSIDGRLVAEAVASYFDFAAESGAVI